MNFSLKATGFCPETLNFTITPSTSNAEEVDVVLESDALYEHLDEDGQYYIRQGSFSKFCQDNWDLQGAVINCRNINERGERNSHNYFLSEGTCGTTFSCSTVSVEQTLREISDAFYAFHKAQDESAQLTIEKIRSLRVEDIVGEQSWEVVKTTSRRGTRRG